MLLLVWAKRNALPWSPTWPEMISRNRLELIGQYVPPEVWKVVGRYLEAKDLTFLPASTALCENRAITDLSNFENQAPNEVDNESGLWESGIQSQREIEQNNSHRNSWAGQFPSQFSVVMNGKLFCYGCRTRTLSAKSSRRISWPTFACEQSPSKFELFFLDWLTKIQTRISTHRHKDSNPNMFLESENVRIKNGTKNIICLKTPNPEGYWLTPSELGERSFWSGALLSVHGVVSGAKSVVAFLAP